MFATAHKAAKEVVGSQSSSADEFLTIPQGSLPERYSLCQLHAALATSYETEGPEEKLQEIVILSSCLRLSAGLIREPGDGTFVDQLSLWLSKAILPNSSVISQDDIAPSTSSPSRENALSIARQNGSTGLLTLQSLLNLCSKPPAALDPQILLSPIAFTSARDAWTTPFTLSAATSLLSKHTHQTHTSTFIVDYVLQKFIRPLFSKSKPEAITASGRKAMPSSAPPRRFEAADQEPGRKPWMYEVPYTITVFEWIVANSSTEIATAHFNLYIPPLLTLLDSINTPTRSRALSILSTFLPLLTPKLLNQTGLGEVFEDAIMPTLMFLPNLTPVDESVQLLEPAYHALIILGSVLYENAGKDGRSKEQKNGKEKGNNIVGRGDDGLKFWDRVLRKGILMGYAHANEHPAIVEVLVRNLGLVIAKMGLNAVKHLKDVLPIISTVLTDPFAPSRASLLLVALKTLQATILNTWPRMSEPGHKIEVIRAVTICWSNISQGQSGVKTLEEMKKEVCIAGTMLVHAVKEDEDIDLKKELEPLFAVDPSLRQVFGMGDG